MIKIAVTALRPTTNTENARPNLPAGRERVKRHDHCVWSHTTMSRTRRVEKTAIQKPLCRLCECPTSDGHVLAWQVDRLKLRKWAMKVMNLTEEDENLPEVVEEDALICYFCIWHAEFGDESGDEAVAWWPKNLDLEENARVLRENYSVGEVDQCWVQLEEVDLAKYEKKIPLESKEGQGLCLYCGNSFNHLLDHVRVYHKEAIKCGYWGCTTFFHTEVEKEQHMDFHKKPNEPCESRKIRCKYCENVNIFSSFPTWRKHMKRNHPELPVACTRYGCKEYFKSKSEMILHLNSFHNRAVNQDVYQCKHCEYFTTLKHLLKRHEEAKHMPKTFKCDRCDTKFGSKWQVERHYKDWHIFDKCKSCGQDVSLGYKADHGRPLVCSRCKRSFECSGLYQSHRKSYRGTNFRCGEFKRHVQQDDSKTRIFRCDHCDFSTFEKGELSRHMQRKHFPKTIKCDECDNFFSANYLLKYHKRRSHEYVRCADCVQEMLRQKIYKHQLVKTCRRCGRKFKCSGLFQKHCLKSCQNRDFSCNSAR
ncbi:oocyte zinc finger protein XlCOF6-like isoform X2 [Cloeon dipterum]|uniref:oocyte zinc finger protein XlCOF6-like isoform X2 n=1 Tax=Cloeon dipterum TaxID=197152 RepID=UPI00321FC799